MLGVSMVRLVVDADDVERATAATAGFRSAQPVRGGELRFVSTGETGTVVAILHALDRARIEPLELTIERPTLDDVFVSLTRSQPER